MHRLAKCDCSLLSPPPVQDDWAPQITSETTSPAPNAVKAECLTISFGKTCLLLNTDLKIAEHSNLVEASSTATGEAKLVKSGLCYGLVGPNGCGKSTLLKLLASGSLLLPESWDTVIVDQALLEAGPKTPVEEVLDSHTVRAALLGEVSSLEQEVSDDPQRCLEISQKIENLYSQLSQWDGEDQVVARLLIGLGFNHAAVNGSSAPSLETPMCKLSGGWQMKVQLAKALWLQPKLLLLDEPTNHLDFRALLWLEDRLRVYPHTVVVVSHDVTFLHDSCSEILWINDKKVEALPRDMVTQEDLARMQRRHRLNFKFTAAEDAPDHGISFHGVTFDYDATAGKKKPLLRVPGNVRFTGRSRSVLLGQNGSGKSTFLQLCRGMLAPHTGSVDRTAHCKVGHYSQLNDELDRESEESAAAFIVGQCYDVLCSKLGLTACTGQQHRKNERALFEHARGVLSQFGIEGDTAVGVPACRLSGGQKACVKFAAVSLRPSHILLLDEPTNHLDAEAREALAKGLSEFEGGVVVVTHDDMLIYRLIQCNWSEADLVVCQGGIVRRELEFGAHKLKSLKEQVRHAEEMEVAAELCNKNKSRARPTKLKVPECKTPSVSFQPSTPPGFVRVSKKLPTSCKPRAQEVLSNNSAPRPSSEKQPIRSKPRAQEVPSNISASRPSVKHVKQQVTFPDCQAKPDDGRTIAASHSATIKISASFITPSVVEIANTKSAQAEVDTPDSWLQLVDVEKVKGTRQQSEDNDDDSMELQCDTADVLEEKKCTDVPDSWQTMAGPSDKQTDPDCRLANTSSRHSQQRKHLVNLNKAITKWQKCVAKGSMTQVELEARIRCSPVVTHLQSVHGHEFCGDDFVQKARRHAAGGA